MEYCKINTLFKRDANNIIIPSQFTCEEFEYLKDNLWECTEKIDGTNTYIELLPVWNNTETEVIDIKMEFHGRTSKAQIPEHLLTKLKSLFDKTTLTEYFFKDKEPCNICIYGEGYGAKIQKGGNYIKDGVNFILFDVLVDNKWWLKREVLEQIARDLNIDIVPLIGYMTIPEAIDYVIRNFGVKAEYDEENNIINLTTSNINEGLQLLAAKEYIDNNFDKDFIHTNLDD